MEPEKPAFAISVPSEDPEAKDKDKKPTNGADQPAGENAAASSSKKAATDGKAEPAADELVRLKAYRILRLFITR